MIPDKNHIKKALCLISEAKAMAIGGLLSNITPFDTYAFCVFLYCMVRNFMLIMLAVGITPQHVSVSGSLLWKRAQAHNQNTK